MLSFLESYKGVFHLFPGSEICVNYNEGILFLWELMWTEMNRILSDLLAILSMVATQSSYATLNVLQKLGVLPHGIILCLEGRAGMTKAPGTAWSYVCPYFVIGWTKQTPTCCFKFFCQKNLCALVRAVWSQPTADKTILIIPTKRKNREMKWNGHYYP